MSAMADSCAVRIAVRERPIREIMVDSSDGCSSVVAYHHANPNILMVDGRPFAFDNILSPDVSQVELFEILIKPLVGKVLQGFNCTALAYGQTGTGKSYSMGLNSKSAEGENVGIIPRCFAELFPEPSSDIENTETNARKIFASFIEIYNEKVYDLLAENTSEPIAARGYKYTGGTRKQICNIEDCYNILTQANKNRHVRPTKMNSQSSRSHAIFSIHISFVQENKTIAASLNFVDLAGSEGVRRTGHQGVARSEGVHINQGLLTIGKVLHAMTMGYKVIPYRDSVLTSVLQDSLSPNSYLTLLACISPHRDDLSESLSTLRFAQNAKQLKYSPQINATLAEIKKNTPRKGNMTPCKNAPFGLTSIKRPALFASSGQKSCSRNHRNTFATPNKLRRMESSKFNNTAIEITSQAKQKTIAANGYHPLSVEGCHQDATKSFQHTNDTIDSRSSLFSLNVSSSTRFDLQSSAKSMFSYSPAVRKCMDEFERIIDSKMEKMMDTLRNVHASRPRLFSPSNSETTSYTVLETPVQNTQLPSSLRQELKSIVKDVLLEQSAAGEKTSREVKKHESEGSIDQGMPNAQCQLFATSSPIFKVPDISLVLRKKQSNRSKAEEDLHSVYEEADEAFQFNTELSERTVLTNVGLQRSRRRSERKLSQSCLSTTTTSSHTHRRSTRLSSIKQQNDNRRRSIRIASQLEAITQKENVAPKKKRGPLVNNSLIASYFDIKNTNVQTGNKKSNISEHKKAILDLINRGSLKELQVLPQVGQKTAYQIVTQRTLKGKFKNLVEVGKLPVWRGKAWERFSKANMLL